MPCYQGTGLGCPVALLAGFPSKSTIKGRCSILCPTHHGQYITLRLLYHLQCIVVIGGENPSRSSKIEIGCSKWFEEISYSKNNQYFSCTETAPG